jgi:hypothetical protein
MLCNAVALYQPGLSFCLLLLLKKNILVPAQLHASLLQHLLVTPGMMDLTQLIQEQIISIPWSDSNAATN